MGYEVQGGESGVSEMCDEKISRKIRSYEFIKASDYFKLVTGLNFGPQS